jgi:hypothetical protein
MISVASAFLLLAAPPPATKLEDALQICARIQNPTDRLACFEGLAKSSAPDASGTGSTSAGQTAPNPPVTASEQRAARKAKAGTASEQRAAKKAKAQTASEQRAASRERQRQAKAEDLGERQAYDAVVRHAWEYSTGDYYVALTNGEIWKSEAQDKGRPVNDGETVELRPGFAGSWFMNFKTITRPALRVRLVE